MEMLIPEVCLPNGFQLTVFQLAKYQWENAVLSLNHVPNRYKLGM